MRLAVLADIHGNRLALQAVMADLAGLGIDRIVDLGDSVSGPLWPRETLDLLRAEGWPMVRGNHDRWVGEGAPRPLSRTDAFAREQLDPEQRRWIAALPRRIAIGGIAAFHGRPDDDDAYLLEDVAEGRLVMAPPATVAARLRGVEAGLVLCAHSHLAALVRLPDGRWIVNPGSVGCPAYADPTPPAHVSESGSPAARYAVVTLDAAAPGEGLRVDLRAILYDHAAAAHRARSLQRPDWAVALSTGYAAATAEDRETAAQDTRPTIA